MPIKTKRLLPAREILENENIFVMDETRALSQEIRPLEVGILNLMPLKEDTELQLLRSFSNTPLQVNVTLVNVSSHVSQNTAQSHLNEFYVSFAEAKKRKFDGFIITGAPVEQLEFEEVDYWQELTEIMDWTRTNVTSTLHICWGAQAGLYHYYGIKKHLLETKLFGIYPHKVQSRKEPLVRGFDDVFYAPHSRHTQIDVNDIIACSELSLLAKSDEAGAYLMMAEEGRKIFVMGHPEYDRMTLDKEYRRDRDKGLPISVPKNYYPDDNPDNKPNLLWRAHCNTLYSNWLNYYVYQATPYDVESIGNK